MQAIAGIHFNYSFSPEFFQSYRELMSPTEADSMSFMDTHYMGYNAKCFENMAGLIPYLFGASATVCKSFMHDYHEHNLEEFDD